MFVFDFLSWVDLVGYLGGAVTVWAMYGKTMIPLRLGVVCGNVSLLFFGLFAGSWPTVALHTILLPLNSIRLFQMIRLVREMNQAQVDSPWEPLTPYMRRSTVSAGIVLFRKGDPSDQMILIESGTIRLEEIEVEIGSGEVLGEIGLFAPGNCRTCTATAATDCVLDTINNEILLQLFYQNPGFALALVRIIVRRLLDNWQAAEGRSKSMMQ